LTTRSAWRRCKNGSNLGSKVERRNDVELQLAFEQPAAMASEINKVGADQDTPSSTVAPRSVSPCMWA
jgi:hypothetical protein